MADRLHFGSIEEKEKQRLAAAKAEGTTAAATTTGGGGGPMGSAAIQAAIKAGNVNIAEVGKTEVMELTDTSREAQERQAVLLRRLEAEKKKRSLIVPTNPVQVIATLRSLGQPITLFGEKVGDRRERLREYLATAELDEDDVPQAQGAAAGEGLLGAAPPSLLVTAQDLVPRHVAVKGAIEGAAAAAPPVVEPAAMEQDNKAAAEKKSELFYTVGAPELVEARKVIAIYSFQHAASRLQRLKRKREVLMQRKDESPEAAEAYRVLGETYDLMRRLGINQSQLGDDRPVAGVRVSPGTGELLATGSWTNACKIWDSKMLEELVSLRGHTERISALAWMPEGGSSSSSIMGVDGGGNRKTLASASVDGTARIWDISIGSDRTAASSSATEAQVLRGHASRLAQVEFHPSGRYVGTTSWDYTWRLWDVETGQELLLQEGHIKETHAIAFQGDGALVVTGDYAGIGHVWDLRSGKSIWVLQGHTQKILTADWHPNGYQVATGSGENVVKIWDVRKKKCYYTLPAHSALISSVRYNQDSGEFLATASFDGTAKIWGTRDFRLLKTLAGHEGRIVGVDWYPDGRRLVTASHDRTFKVWADQKDF